MSHSNQAVFLSYASQDAEAVARIAEALRAAGVEVWFDKNELVGGDAWDAKIRGQIARCALFVPVISTATQARLEGYFRIEWKLAAQRTHAMADEKAFLLPVVIDDTRDAEAKVPAEFRAVQWTRLAGGEGAEKFCERIAKLLGGESGTGASPVSGNRGQDARAMPRSQPVRGWLVPAIIGFAALLALVLWQPWRIKGKTPAVPSATPVAVVTAVQQVETILAKTDVTRGELDLASDLLAESVKDHPIEARIFANWALLDCRYLDEFYDNSPARREAARRHAAKATGLDPQSRDARLAQAVTLRRLTPDAATHAEVLKMLEALQREEPHRAQVLSELAWCHYHLGHDAEAQASLERVEALPGKSAAVRFDRGRMSFKRRDFAGALRQFEQSDSVKGLLWRSYLQILWKGDLAGAQLTISRVPTEYFVEDMPALAKFWVEFMARDYERALATMRAIPRDFIEAGAGFGPTGYYRGLALSRLGRAAAAESEWRSALAAVEQRLPTQQSDGPMLIAKALLLSMLEDRAASDRVWQTAKELDGDSGDWMEVDLAAHQLAPDAALAWLDKGIRELEPHATAAILRLRPSYDDLRRDPRFVGLQNKADADPKLGPRVNGSLYTAKAPAADPGDKSVAVLAFANLSDDKANEYFSDGISEELINVLGRVPGLTVKGRASSFYFKNSAATAQEKGQKLGATFLVDGSVRKMGNAVRITAQVIRAATDEVMWSSEPLVREVKDVFAVQEEIAGMIAKALSLKLGVASVASASTINPEAYRLYAEGRRAWSMRGTEDFLEKAVDFYRRAIAADPKLGRAYSGLADALRNTGSAELRGLTFADRDSDRVRELQSLVETALRLEPESAEAYASRGATFWESWRVAEAERDLRTAIRLNPNYADAHQILGRLLSADGRMDEALVEMRLASELDPLSSRIFDNYSSALREAGHNTEALAMAERAVALQPDALQALRGKWEALSNLGRLEEALTIAQSPVFREQQYRTVALLVRAGRKDEAAKLYANLPSLPRRLTTSPLAALGRYDEALDSLQPDNAPMLLVSGHLYLDTLDPIRNDPRFVTYLTTLGIKAAHDRAQAWRAAHPPEKIGATK